MQVWSSLVRTGWSCALVSMALLGVACQKEDPEKAKKIEELKLELQKGMERETGLKDELEKVTRRVTQLQNDFKIYSQKPCDYELDAIEYSIAKKDDPGSGMSATPPDAMRTAPDPDKKRDPGEVPAESADVLKKIRTARYDIKTCYESAMRKNPALQSETTSMTLKFTVLPAGSVTNVQVNPPVGSGFEGCVRGVLGGWSFAKYTGSPRVYSQRMNLRPQ
jgi:hypothetical protein